MLEIDWSGKVRGSVFAQGFSGPSPDGSRFLRTTDHVTVEDWRGHWLGPLAVDPTFYGLPTWADDSQHVCGISFLRTLALTRELHRFGSVPPGKSPESSDQWESPDPILPA